MATASNEVTVKSVIASEASAISRLVCAYLLLSLSKYWRYVAGLREIATLRF